MAESIVYSLDPAEIECSGPWLLHPEAPAEKVITSIRKNGQFVPVLLVEEGGKTFLVAGRARVEAARKLGIEVLGIYIEAPDATSRAVAHLEENSSKDVNDFIKCATVRFFSERVGEDEIPQLFNSVFGIKVKSREMGFWMDWLRIENEFDIILCNGNIPLAAVQVLAKISSADRAALLPYFEKVSWSRSNAVNFLTWLYETARRNGCSVAAIVSEGSFSPIMENESPKDAVTRLCKTAKSLRYPVLNDLEQTHMKITSEICAGTRWKVEPVGSFETGEVMVQTRFKSREMFEKAIADLEAISRFEGWETIFNLGRDK